MRKSLSALVFVFVTAVANGRPPAVAKPLVVSPSCQGASCSTTVRSSTGQIVQQSTTTGAASLFRDGQGRIIGTANTGSNGSVVVRDAKGQYLFTATPTN